MRTGSGELFNGFDDGGESGAADGGVGDGSVSLLRWRGLSFPHWRGDLHTNKRLEGAGLRAIILSTEEKSSRTKRAIRSCSGDRQRDSHGQTLRESLLSGEKFLQRKSGGIAQGRAESNSASLWKNAGGRKLESGSRGPVFGKFGQKGRGSARNLAPSLFGAAGEPAGAG